MENGESAVGTRDYKTSHIEFLTVSSKTPHESPIVHTRKKVYSGQPIPIDDTMNTSMFYPYLQPIQQFSSQKSKYGGPILPNTPIKAQPAPLPPAFFDALALALQKFNFTEIVFNSVSDE